MEKFLASISGQKIDVSCGNNATVRGEVVEVNEGILRLQDDNQNIVYVAVDKIMMVWEVKDSETRTGFVAPKK